MKIGPLTVGTSPICIAEASINHCGSIDRALEMIGAAKRAGCDIVKFQTFKARDVCDETQMYTYHSAGRTITEARIHIFRRCELPDTAWPVLKAECDRQGILFMSTPETPADVDLLLRTGIPAIKIGSDNLTNLPMLRYCAAPDVGFPILLSCGMGTPEDVRIALETIYPAQVLLMACTSEYPCPAQSANLGRLVGAADGFSDHTVGSLAVAVAVGAGATVFEKHFTLDHMLDGPEHWWAAGPDELADWVHTIRTAHTMMGSGRIEPTEGERVAKAKYQRVVSA